MKVTGALSFPKALLQVPSLGPAMLPEQQGNEMTFGQSGFDINGLHNQRNESPLKRHAITRTGLKKRKEIMIGSWELKETTFSLLSYAYIFKGTLDFFRLQRKYLVPLFFPEPFI